MPDPVLANVDAVWKPEEWAIDQKRLEAYQEKFTPVKMEILKRLYPGLRRLAKSDPGKFEEFYERHFIERELVVKPGSATEDKYLYWWDDPTKRPPTEPANF